ncbi:MAG: outer membrane beta-barrel domain-containing protein [Bdellovibrio sp.]|nr:outer membrane beta-barrel domain-containing protein [Bdellovibrio sp.]
MIKIAFSVVALICSVSFAQVQQEIDSFGGNESLYNKAQALNPGIQTDVVQNRFIERTHHFELAPEIGGVFGGDSYNKSNNFGMNAYFHLSPNWAIGAKYNYYTNKLTPEGEATIARASQAAVQNPGNPAFLYPQVVFPKSEMMATVSWYPIVGKLSFGSWGVAHFDTYFLAGYGTIDLNTGSSSQAALGAGLGFWLTPHMTTRLEYRQQNYTAKYYDQNRGMSVGTASVQVGWLL